MNRFLALPVLLTALTVSSLASINVSSPTNAATVQSPVHFVASASSREKITGMVIYVDSKNVYSTSAASLNTSLAMASGQHAIVVKAWNSEGKIYSDSMTLQVKAATSTPTPTALKLTSSSLSNGTVGSSYAASLTATGGTSPYTWTVASGALPGGLKLSTAGAVSGTPTASGTFSFSITVKDSASSPQAATASFAMTIAAAPTSGSTTTSATSPSNYVNIVNGQQWPLNFVPFCNNSAQECPWNNQLPDSPTLMANSASMVSGLFGSSGGMTGLPDAAIQGGTSADFAHPVYLASASDPLVTLASTCGSGAGTAGSQIHIPAQARPTVSSDAHMGVIQPNGDEWDFWNTTNPGRNWQNGDTIYCQDSGNHSNIVTGAGSLPHSATSGAALSSGDLRVNELQNGLIAHALFVVIPSSNGYVYPGQSAAAQGGSIPMGARFQLKYTDAQINAMTGLAAWEKTLLHQMHDYGVYALDTGGDGYMTYKWESPTQYTSFGATNPGVAWNSANKPPATWKPAGINWATDLQIVSTCYAEGTC